MIIVWGVQKSKNVTLAFKNVTLAFKNVTPTFKNVTPTPKNVTLDQNPDEYWVTVYF